MPVGYEYENGDVYIENFVCMDSKKEVTRPEVVRRIVENKMSAVHFEANNGGDEYADWVKLMLKQKEYNCNITHAKVPTSKRKVDRILAEQAVIRGERTAEYRFIYRSDGNKEYKEAMGMLCKFNQKASKQNKQHDDVPDALASLSNNVLGHRERKGIVKSMASRSMYGI